MDGFISIVLHSGKRYREETFKSNDFIFLVCKQTYITKVTKINTD